jgi:hypothetical protein
MTVSSFEPALEMSWLVCLREKLRAGHLIDPANLEGKELALALLPVAMADLQLSRWRTCSRRLDPQEGPLRNGLMKHSITHSASTRPV